MPEKDLYDIAMLLKDNEYENICILIKHIANNNISESCDWNIGSILQHLDYNLIVQVLKEIPIAKRAYFYESIGLTWCLGEANIRNNYISEFLYDVLNYTRNSEAWWRAAFALEKITGKNAINNLKRSLKNRGINSLDDCLADLSDKKNVIGVLFNANSIEIKNKIYPELKKQFFNNSDKKNIFEYIVVVWKIKIV